MAQLVFIFIVIGIIAITLHSNMKPYRRYVILAGITLPYLTCLVYGLAMQTDAFNPIFAIFTLLTFSTIPGISGTLWLIALASYFMNFIHLIYAIRTMTMKTIGVSNLSERHYSLVIIMLTFQAILFFTSFIIGSPNSLS